MNTIKQQAKASKNPPRLLLSTSFSKGASTSCSSLSNTCQKLRTRRPFNPEMFRRHDSYGKVSKNR
jgi:hypothetical protein